VLKYLNQYEKVEAASRKKTKKRATWKTKRGGKKLISDETGVRKLGAGLTHGLIFGPNGERKGALE